MKCESCGTQVDDEASFCPECGSPLGSAENASASAAPVSSSDAINTGTADAPTINTGASDAANVGVAVNSENPENTVNAAGAAQNPDTGNTNNRTGLIVLVCVLAVAVVVVFALLFVNLSASEEGALKLTGMVNTDASTFVKGPEQESGGADASGSQAADGSESAGSGSGAQANSGDYMIADSNTRLLTAADLASLSDWELYIARNEIYARAGRGFNNADLREYFGAKPWYRQLYTPQQFDSYPEDYFLNSTELANAKFILSTEKSRNSSYV